jgi:ArsR family transcriptional regulator
MDPSTNLERSVAERAKCFASLGDPARLGILEHLRRDTHCLCEMQDDLGMAPNLLSYHMRILREAGLVSGRRNGRRVEYRIERKGFQALCGQLEVFG